MGGWCGWVVWLDVVGRQCGWVLGDWLVGRVGVWQTDMVTGVIGYLRVVDTAGTKYGSWVAQAAQGPSVSGTPAFSIHPCTCACTCTCSLHMLLAHASCTCTYAHMHMQVQSMLDDMGVGLQAPGRGKTTWLRSPVSVTRGCRWAPRGGGGAGRRRGGAGQGGAAPGRGGAGRGGAQGPRAWVFAPQLSGTGTQGQLVVYGGGDTIPVSLFTYPSCPAPHATPVPPLPPPPFPHPSPEQLYPGGGAAVHAAAVPLRGHVEL